MHMQEPDGEGKQGLYEHGQLLDHVAAPPAARQEARLGLQRAHRAPGQHAAQHGRVDGDGYSSATHLLHVAEEDPNQGTLVHHSQYFENVKGHSFIYEGPANVGFVVGGRGGGGSAVQAVVLRGAAVRLRRCHRGRRREKIVPQRRDPRL